MVNWPLDRKNRAHFTYIYLFHFYSFVRQTVLFSYVKATVLSNLLLLALLETCPFFVPSYL